MNAPDRAASARPDAHESGSPLQKRARTTAAICTFFALSFVWSWGIGYAAGHSRAFYPALSSILMIVSGFGPSVAGVAVVAFFSTGAGLRKWLAGLLNWQVGWRWYALAFFLPPCVMLLALAFHAALGGAIPASPAIGHIPLAVANFGLVFLIGGPLGEELGWRGYAASALSPKMGWRAASLVIGVIWGLWHLPWFYTPGTAQAMMPMPVFMLNILAGSVLFSWLFMQTGGSVGPALVIHTSLNAWAGILSIIPTANTARPYELVTGILVVMSGILLLRNDTPPSRVDARS